MELPNLFDRPDRSKMYHTPDAVLAHVVECDRDNFIRANAKNPPWKMNESGWVQMPSGRWTKTVLKAVNEYYALSAFPTGEWWVSHAGGRVAQFTDRTLGADLAGAQALAEEAAAKLRE